MLLHSLIFSFVVIIILSTYLELIKGLFPEADGHDELEDGGELVQVEVVTRRKVSKRTVEGSAHAVIQRLRQQKKKNFQH